ncbi:MULTISPECIES: non-homologous end-joining DNA ligase [unclassified Guyparkeria]|uniref:non-homologous end-joining DNA ligase n=1 Tax=unclassified Guyparkeria TaxID=2626246 RepID=UPI00073374F4|nr:MULTISPECIES: non-homologous end-joining DNA ligase [unclassified Guyparkeria]KTG16186.1 ATP-dependent DNA ligase [Guyparkeria sp. XI15]OAE85037.1 ATP-dependent DNA ligase [Guyparkeria sp. WRN-7]
MGDRHSQLDQDEEKRLEPSAMPDWVAPMLATLTDARFSSPDWLYERKLDGERCLVFRDDDGARILSRNKKALNRTYPELVEPLESACDRPFIADGEIVAFDGNVTSFSRLQQRIGITDPDKARESGVAVVLYLFDLIYLEDSRLDQLPLRRRKALLRSTLAFEDPLRFTAHRNEDGETFFDEACRKGWEGLIAKRADAPYHHSRSRDWLKFKCVNQQELVIVGFTDPKGERHGFGALLLGYYEDDELRYAGKVGTGFDDRTLTELHAELAKRERRTAPVENGPDLDSVHWVTPELVAEIGFTEWTEDGRLRHPRFLGLRDDKPATAVHRERPKV